MSCTFSVDVSTVEPVDCPFLPSYMSDVLGVPFALMVKNEVIPETDEERAERMAPNPTDDPPLIYRAVGLRVIPSSLLKSRVQAALREIGRQPDEFVVRGKTVVVLRSVLKDLGELAEKAYRWGRYVEVQDG